ncbi:MAG TPA: hypothetical protein VMT30_04510 [Candidatus Saccharimonadia bacterium]|nr:hypothetical protein [Candidatus Saccharimonadia bacterium]
MTTLERGTEHVETEPVEIELEPSTDGGTLRATVGLTVADIHAAILVQLHRQPAGLAAVMRLNVVNNRTFEFTVLYGADVGAVTGRLLQAVSTVFASALGTPVSLGPRAYRLAPRA